MRVINCGLQKIMSYSAWLHNAAAPAISFLLTQCLNLMDGRIMLETRPATLNSILLAQISTLNILYIDILASFFKRLLVVTLYNSNIDCNRTKFVTEQSFSQNKVFYQCLSTKLDRLYYCLINRSQNRSMLI